MSFIAKLQRAREILEQQGRLSTRALERELAIAGDELEELLEELVDVQQVARREGKILVWAGAEMQGIPSSPRVSTETRKVITIIFADLMGSTALQERLDPESVNRVMDAYYQAVRGPVEAAGGTVVQLLGDGVLCAFGIPQVAQDDAFRAVRAAVGIQQAFREFLRTQQWLSVAIGLRVAVNTGEVVVSDEHPAGIGDPLNVAARLQQEARDGEVLIGQATRRLVANAVTLEPAGVFSLKGRAETVTAYRVLSLERPAGATTTAFVGRDDELARIAAVYETARATPAARLAVVLGSPGLGKSRLIGEVARRLGDASVVTAQCDAAGGATFEPVAAALRTWLNAGPADQTDHTDRSARSDPTDPSAALAAAVPEGADRARIISGIAKLLAGSPASPEETFFVIRRFLTALAQTKPVVLVIDDLHWAEPLLLDLVEHLIQWGSGVPLFVLVGARPELRELRSSLVTSGGHVSDVVMLSGLDAGAAMRLAANVIGAADLPAAVAAKVLATSEGNPLFVGELVRMLVDEGAIERQGDRWVVGANLAMLEMPPTIHALLAARIERLRPEERTVLERAAVVGRHFSRAAVAALLSHNGSELDARLEALRRTELIEPDTGWFLGEPVLRFHHVLIRDAAYRRLLKGTRAELHARFAEWVAAHAGEADHDETIGWHLEQAHLLLRELGPLDDAGRTLGRRAARHLASAGRHALGRDDLPVAADLLGRAINCLDTSDAARADLALDWCEALLSAGDVGRAAGAIAELGRFAAARGQTDPSDPSDQSDSQSSRLRAWHRCFASQLTVLTAPQELQAAADAAAGAAAELAKLDDAAGEAKAHSVRAQALARLGKVGACEAALDQALAAARKAGDRRRANAVLAGAPVAALWGPSPVTRASGRCLDVVRVLRITQGAPAVEAVALSCQGVLEALRGRTEAARRMLASSRKMIEDLGIAQRLHEVDFFAGRIALLEGDAAGAERLLRGAYHGLRDLGLGIDAARAGALLARALLAQQRIDDAETLSHESELLAGDDLQAAIAWRGVRAEALAQRGEHAAAVELAEAAVAIASATDALLDHADARMALAAALRAAGRDGEADVERRRATELWETKGATLLAERAQRAEPHTEAVPDTPRLDPAAAVQRSARRRIRNNVAAENGARIAAALAARDITAAERELADSMEIRHHPTGLTYDRVGLMDTLVRLVRSKDLVLLRDALATLGDALALSRQFVTFDARDSQLGPVGTIEHETIMLEEIDATGRRSRTELFAADHLGDAIARLYARYAELLPEGPERERAAVTARALAYILTDSAIADESVLFDPLYEDIDHRNVGYGTLSTEAAQKLVVSQRALADDLRFRVEDILALRPDGLVRKSTTSGVWRDGGGSFERTVCMLSVFGPDGRSTRQETFDSDREAEALARFDALVASTEPGPPAHRRVRPSAATRGLERFQSVIAARDGTALAEVFDESLHTVHHVTRATYGRREMLSTWRSIMNADRLDFRWDILASLGGTLALERHFLSIEGLKEAHVAGFGRSEFDEVVLIETDDRGRWLHCEIFAADRLRSAIVRLYERWAENLSEGPARTRASRTARALAAFDGPLDADRIASVHAPCFLCVDHRTLGTWSAKGRDEWHTHWRGQADLATNWMLRDDDVLALEPAAMVLRQNFVGTGVASGGAFENAVISVITLDADGLITRTEVFEPDQEVEALACFDALVAGGGELHAEPFDNAASRLIERFTRAWAARDWNTIETFFAPAVHVDDRRRLLQMAGAAATNLAYLRFLFDVPGSAWVMTPIATRGERLVLSHYLFRGNAGEGGGPLAIDYLGIDEVDDECRFITVVIFDPDDLDAAYADLDARYYASEGAAYPAHGAIMHAFTHAVASRDWDPVLALCAPEFIEHDHRSLAVLGTTRGAAAWAQNFSTLVDLAPDTVYRVHHFRSAARGFCSVGTWVGSRDGGRYEIPLIAVLELDDCARLARADIYDPDQLDQALARFHEVAAAATWHWENAASRAWRTVIAAWRQRDPERFAALQPRRLRYRDHRRLFQLDLDREGFLEFTRPLLTMRSANATLELLATRGERLALMRFTLEMEDEVVGPSAIDSLLLIETDEQSAIAAYDRYELDDLEAAYAELDARWNRSEGAAHTAPSKWLADYLRYFAERDWSAMSALLAPEVIGENHRLVGWGTRTGPAGIVSTLQAQIELAPDTRERVDHVRTCAGALLFEYAWHGTREGGAFENLWVVLIELDGVGRARRADVWEAEQLEQAQARFEQLRTAVSSHPIAALAKPNAANAAMDRWQAAYDAAFDGGDWDPMRALCAPGFTFEDRRRLALLSGDRELMIASARQRVAMGARPERRVLGTAGDRVAIEGMLWSGGPTDGRFEIEYVGVSEVGESGLFDGMVLFDLDDVREAQREAWARWAAIDPVAAPWVDLLTQITNAWNGRDRSGLRARLADDVVVEDHRHAGLGRIEGADAYVDSNVVLWELAPDQRIELGRSFPAVTRDGVVATARRVGTLAEGGAFESEFVLLGLARDGRLTRVELFEIDALDAALARFEELRPPDPLRIPPNAATRALARWEEAVAAGDQVAVRAAYDSSYRFEDRRRLFRTMVDIEGAVVNDRQIFKGGWQSVRTLLATAGDRLALQNVLWTKGEAGATSEIEMLAIDEVNAEGRFVWTALFDPDDRAAAHAELFERYVAAGADGLPHGAIEYSRGLNGRDLARARTGLCDDFVLEDHRRSAMGHLQGGDAYIASVAAACELTRELTVHPLYAAAVTPQGQTLMVRVAGTNTEGGAFESFYVALVLYRGERIASFEVFEPEDLDVALARFAELCAH